MNTRILGPQGLSVSAVGLGCMGFSQGYGPADDDESLAAIRAALDAGVTFLDTAMSYGDGANESLVGRAVAGRRDEVVLASKFGIVRGPGGVAVDARPDQVRGWCEASLRRLGVEHLDLYYLHRVDPAVPVEDSVGAMAALVEAGLVRHLGVSEVDADQLARAAAVHPVSALQLEWSLSWREAEDDVLPAAARLGIGVVAYSPLGRGLLTGATGPAPFRDGDPRSSGPAGATNRALAAAVGRVAAAHGVPPGQLALAWLLAQRPDVVPVPGSRRAARIVENAGAADIVLSPADLAALEAAAPRSAWAGDRASFAAHRTTRS